MGMGRVDPGAPPSGLVFLGEEVAKLVVHRDDGRVLGCPHAKGSVDRAAGEREALVAAQHIRGQEGGAVLIEAVLDVERLS